jgi:hypothetical protein
MTEGEARLLAFGALDGADEATVQALTALILAVDRRLQRAGIDVTVTRRLPPAETP